MCKNNISSFDKNVGIRIKTFRELKGMSQSEIASLADTTYNEIKNFEKGNQVPYAKLLKICDVLGIKVADVIPTEDLSDIFADPDGLIEAIKNKDLQNVMNLVTKSSD